MPFSLVNWTWLDGLVQIIRSLSSGILVKVDAVEGMPMHLKTWKKQFLHDGLLLNKLH